MRSFCVVSEVPAAVEKVWERVTTPDGINHEIAPYLKMTVPRAFRGKSIGDVASGTRLGRSLLLLFGVIPFGIDDITVAQIEPGRAFREESAMTGMRTWVHHRTLQPVHGRTVVTDTITLAAQLPIPGLTHLLSGILTKFFQHRHRRLLAYFASPIRPPGAGS